MSPDAQAWTRRFNDWRSAYSWMSYSDQQLFYSQVETEFPQQANFSSEAALTFFRRVSPESRVIELGGWKGDLAAAVLTSPLSDRVSSWTNYDICPTLGGKAVCKDPRYRLIVPMGWFWKTAVQDAEVFVATHTIEHLSVKHLEALLVKVAKLPSLQYIYLESPLPDSAVRNRWPDYFGSHILEVGWEQVTGLLSQHGFMAARRSDICVGYRAPEIA